MSCSKSGQMTKEGLYPRGIYRSGPLPALPLHSGSAEATRPSLLPATARSASPPPVRACDPTSPVPHPLLPLLSPMKIVPGTWAAWGSQ